MKILHEHITKHARILPNSIIKVDNFLNHQIDVALMQEIGKEFYERFQNENITKVITVESSGIGVAFATAMQFNVPVLFAKKGDPRNMTPDVYAENVHSYTRNATYRIAVSKQFLTKEDRVLIVDDFLANGQAALGLLSICEQAGAHVCGVGIVIEKCWQRGSVLLREKGVHVESLAEIKEITDEKVIFA